MSSSSVSYFSEVKSSLPVNDSSSTASDAFIQNFAQSVHSEQLSDPVTTSSNNVEVESFGNDALQRYQSTYSSTNNSLKINEQMSFTSTAESNVQLSKRISRAQTTNEPDDDDVYYTPVNYDNCLPMGGSRPYPPTPPLKDLYIVTYDGPNDPIHPFNWSATRKLLTCVILCIDCVVVSWGSSIYAPGIPQLCEQYHVIPVVATLGMTLYVLGFAASPIIYGPLSELYGRKGVMVISAFGFACFQFAVATAENIQTIMLCRFFGGFMGSCPIAVVPAVFADMFDTNFRGKAICLFTIGVFFGPIIGPVMGSYIVQHTTWRWLNYIVGFTACGVLVAVILFVEETHHATILVKKAKLLRQKSGNWGIRAAHEDMEFSMKEICQTTITKPLIMLFTEPILFFITLYNSFVYGILYLLLEAYPIIFVEGYKLKSNGFLPYLALLVGILICSFTVWYHDGKYSKECEKNGKLNPEHRLYPMISAAIAFPIGILWFCWTGYYPHKIHWICPTIAGSFVGYGLMGIFLPCLNYIIETYLLLTASAVAANTFMRSAFGAVFPLFAGYMFHNMGTGWAGLVIGLFSAAMIPVPLLFLKYGRWIRQKSKFAYDE